MSNGEARPAAATAGTPAAKRPARAALKRKRGRRPQAVTNGTNGGARMSERDGNDAREPAPIRVATREQFDEAVEELFRTGQPIEAPSLEMLAA